MNKTERDELRKEADNGHFIEPFQMLEVLDALDEAEQATYTLGKELAEAMLKLDELERKLAEAEAIIEGYENV